MKARKCGNKTRKCRTKARKCQAKARKFPECDLNFPETGPLLPIGGSFHTEKKIACEKIDTIYIATQRRHQYGFIPFHIRLGAGSHKPTDLRRISNKVSSPTNYARETRPFFIIILVRTLLTGEVLASF
jgi:hypothetical protein